MNANFALQDHFLALFFSGPLAEHFYLTRGTALARFYFHHRQSLDLDLFTNDQARDFAQVNQAVLGILHALDLRITSQVTTDTFIQYIVTDEVGTSLKVDLGVRGTRSLWRSCCQRWSQGGQSGEYWL